MVYGFCDRSSIHPIYFFDIFIFQIYKKYIKKIQANWTLVSGKRILLKHVLSIIIQANITGGKRKVLLRNKSNSKNKITDVIFKDHSLV